MFIDVYFTLQDILRDRWAVLYLLYCLNGDKSGQSKVAVIYLHLRPQDLYLFSL